MLFAIFLLIAVMALISVYNIATIYRPNQSATTEEEIAVLIPVRNESSNAAELVATLKGQIGSANAHFYILDDGSTDTTLEILRTTINLDPRFTVITGKPLPQGWLGKPWALHQLESASHESTIITLDADVRLRPDAIARATALLTRSQLDFISPYPQQIAQSFIEKIIQPLVHWTWIATVPLQIAARAHRPSMAVANGQFFLVRRSALSEVGGFSVISNEVLDDVMLARTLLRAGFSGTACQGADIAHTRMYSSFSDIQRGYGKSLWKAFGSAAGPYIAIALIFATSLYPFLHITSVYGAVASTAILFTRFVSAVIAREKFRYIFFHPLSAALLIYLIIYSLLFHSRITWKDRTL